MVRASITHVPACRVTHWNVQPIIDGPGVLGVAIAEHDTCYFGSGPLGLMAYTWSLIGTWKQLCDGCAYDVATAGGRPMRGYEPCEEHRCSIAECRSLHRVDEDAA